MAHNRSHPRLFSPSFRVPRAFVTCALLLLLLSGCGDRLGERRQGTALPLDFAPGLPSGWEAVDGWHEVSIDGDVGLEYLLLFRFDVGQIGAVIYDNQINGRGIEGSVEDGVAGSVEPPGASGAATGTPESGGSGIDDATGAEDERPTATAIQGSGVPSQGFGYYRPYRLLPSYWAFSYGGDPGHGIVAPPESADAVDVMVVPLGEGEQTPDAPAEMLLRGGNTHLTFVWWKGALEGYGVTQLVAYGGFTGIDWAEWVEDPTPITAISGLEPLLDYRARSQICRQVDYIRRTPGVLNLDNGDATGEPDGESADGDVTDGDVTVNDVNFAAEDRGLRFCSEAIPAYPFYPEGVVLAYLQRPPRGDLALERLVAPNIATAQIDADGALERLPRERIDDIATYRTIPVPPGGVQTGEFAPTTSVCVQLSERESPSIRRWLVFTLRYQPPDNTTQLPDRWSIAGVRFEPQPVTPPQRPYCETVLARSAP